MTISINQPTIEPGIIDTLAQAGADMLSAFANCTALVAGNNLRGEFRRKRADWQTEDIRFGGVEQFSLSVLNSEAGSTIAHGDAVSVTHDTGDIEEYVIVNYSRIRELDRLDIVLERT